MVLEPHRENKVDLNQNFDNSTAQEKREQLQSIQNKLLQAVDGLGCGIDPEILDVVAGLNALGLNANASDPLSQSSDS